MDPVVVSLWLLRLLFLALLYVFLFAVARALLRDLRAAAREPERALGRLIVLASSGEPAVGSTFPLGAVTTIGRDVNNGLVLADPFASAEHAVLTYRGRAWYVEDLGSRNGTLVNGEPTSGVVPLAFGDELSIGEARLRLERPPG